MNRDGTTTSPAAQHRVTRALQRGLDTQLPGVAVYGAGEEVRCPRTRSRHDGTPLGLCGGYLFTLGPDSVAHVRPYDDRRFQERRATSRGNYRCSRCEGRLEIEHHAVRAAA